MMTVASIRMKRFLGPIAIWVLALFTIFAFPRDLPEITGFAILLFPLTGLILLVVFTVAVFRTKERRPAAIAILLVTIIGATYFARGLQWGARVHLLINRSRYEATIAKLSAARSFEEREAICGDDDCMILSDEPLRVTFHFCHAFLYWPDIVHDPTGAVSDRDISNLHKLNVYLFGAKRLTGNWYLADFGD
jgi:hypothetical protein